VNNKGTAKLYICQLNVQRDGLNLSVELLYYLRDLRVKACRQTETLRPCVLMVVYGISMVY